MKIEIPHSMLMNAITGAGVAAFTPEAQDEEITKKIPTQSCILIVATESEISFESAVSRIASKHVVPVGENVKVLDAGAICVQARWLSDNMSTTAKSNTLVVFETFADKDYSDSGEKIVPNGRCKLVLSEAGQEAFSWEGETYSHTKFTDTPNYVGTVLATFDADAFSKAFKAVSFSTDPTDYKSVRSKVAIKVDAQKLYLASTDGKRATRYTFPAEVVGEGNRLILVDPDLMSSACAGVSSKASLLMDADGKHVIVKNDITAIRLSIVDEASSSEFPNVVALVEMPFPRTYSVNSGKLGQALGNLSKTNNARFMVSYSPTSTTLSLEAVDEEKGRKAKAGVLCKPSDDAIKAGSLALSMVYVTEIAKRLDSEWLCVGFSEDGSKIRIQSEDSPNLVCVMAKMRTT